MGAEKAIKDTKVREGMHHFPQWTYDVAIVGGGPAGLTAANYLARYLRSVVVFDSGDARANLIPKTHNCPGFPDGVSGGDLLQRLRQQAITSGAKIVEGCVEAADKRDGTFVLSTSLGAVTASCLVLATGIVDIAPAIPELSKAIASGSVRLCPVCDAFEVRGRRVGVVGPGASALREARFLKHYSPHVLMLANHPADFSRSVRTEAVAAEIELWDQVVDLIPLPIGFEVIMSDGTAREIDVIYPSMGCDVRSELAQALGAHCDDDGYVLVGEHLETSVAQLYAIGDVAKALNQIAVGFGHAALAASHIHNFLAARRMGR